MSESSIPGRLHDLVRHAERIRSLYESAASRAEFLSDDDRKDAVLWNFVVVGEVCRRLGKDYQAKNPHIPWRAIVAHRDVIAHGYDIVDWNKVADVIEQHIPTLICEARRLLLAFGPPPQDQ